MGKLHRETIVKHLGQVDSRTVDRLVETAATETDLVEAVERLKKGEVARNRPGIPNERVEEVCEVLRLAAEDDPTLDFA